MTVVDVIFVKKEETR